MADGRAGEVSWTAPPAIILLALVKGVALFAQTVQVNALALRVTTDLQKDMARTLIEADLAVLSRAPALRPCSAAISPCASASAACTSPSAASMTARRRFIAASESPIVSYAKRRGSANREPESYQVGTRKIY